MEKLFSIFTTFQAEDLLQFGAYFHFQLSSLCCSKVSWTMCVGSLCSGAGCCSIPLVLKLKQFLLLSLPIMFNPMQLGQSTGKPADLQICWDGPDSCLFPAHLLPRLCELELRARSPAKPTPAWGPGLEGISACYLCAEIRSHCLRLHKRSRDTTEVRARRIKLCQKSGKI